MRGYAMLCGAMRCHAGLCGAMRGYVGLCGVGAMMCIVNAAMRGYAVLCGAMRAGENSCPPTACNDVPFMDPSLIISYFQ